MLRHAWLLFLLPVFVACQPQTTVPVPTVVPTTQQTAVALPTALPPTQQAPASSALFFDGFDMMDAHSGWAWQGMSRLFRTDDGGANWTEIHLLGQMLTTGAAFLSPTDAWLTGLPDADLMQTVFHTSDGGKTWTPLGRVHGPNTVLYFLDSKLGWATNGIGATGNVFYQVSQTEDGGQTWTQWQASSPGQSGQQPLAGAVHTATGDSLAFTAPDTMWVASGHDVSTPYAGLAVSRDSGKTWIDLDPALPAAFVAGQPPVNAAAPHFVSTADAYLPVTVGGRLIFFASHDGGLSWRFLSQVAVSSQAVPRVQFVNASDGFAVCAPALCVTHDAAQTWDKVAAPFTFDASGSGSYVVQFDFVNADTGWAIVTDRAGHTLFVKTTDGGRTWTDVGPRLGF